MWWRRRYYDHDKNPFTPCKWCPPGSFGAVASAGTGAKCEKCPVGTYDGDAKSSSPCNDCGLTGGSKFASGGGITCDASCKRSHPGTLRSGVRTAPLSRPHVLFHRMRPRPVDSRVSRTASARHVHAAAVAPHKPVPRPSFFSGSPGYVLYPSVQVPRHLEGPVCCVTSDTPAQV